jgi:hypothetical protein
MEATDRSPTHSPQPAGQAARYRILPAQPRRFLASAPLHRRWRREQILVGRDTTRLTPGERGNPTRGGAGERPLGPGLGSAGALAATRRRQGGRRCPPDVLGKHVHLAEPTLRRRLIPALERNYRRGCCLQLVASKRRQREPAHSGIRRDLEEDPQPGVTGSDSPCESQGGIHPVRQGTGIRQ